MLPAAGGYLGFLGTDGTHSGGYGIEFDVYNNSAFSDPSANHIALIEDGLDNHLAYVNDTRVKDNLWHTVKVYIFSGGVKVYVDNMNSAVLEWSGALVRTYGGFGFGGATGGLSQSHIIDEVKNFYSTRKKLQLHHQPKQMEVLLPRKPGKSIMAIQQPLL